MRVLHITPDLGPTLGGTTASALGICSALARQGATVTLVATDLDEVGSWRPFYRPTTRGPITEHQSGLEIRLFPTQWPSRFGYSPALRHYLRENIRNFDLVHVHRLYRFSTVAGAFEANRAGIPYLVDPHGVLLPYHRKRRWLRKKVFDLVQGVILERAAAVHYSSEYELGSAESLRLSAPPIVISAGVDPAEFSHLPPRALFEEHNPELTNKRLIVFLGRIARQKGLDLLMEAFEGVAAQFEDAHLVIAGSDPEGYRSTVTSWVYARGLTRRVTFLGPVHGERKLELLGATEVWVLPSYAENFGIAIVEAMASRLPVIISNRVGIAEEVHKADAGVIVSCDHDDLKRAMLSLLSDAALREKLGRNGSSLVTRRYTWDGAAGEMLHAYEAVLAKRRSVQGVLA